MRTTEAVLRAACAAGVRRVVLASSSSVYGTAAGPVAEDAPLRPLSHYGRSKLRAERMAARMAGKLGIELVVLRYFTVYGPRQRPDMAFAKFATAALGGDAMPLLGDGGQTRDFTYVADACEATLLAVERGRPGAVYNVSGGRPATLAEAFGLLGRGAGRGRRADPDRGGRPRAAQHRRGPVAGAGRPGLRAGGGPGRGHPPSRPRTRAPPQRWPAEGRPGAGADRHLVRGARAVGHGGVRAPAGGGAARRGGGGGGGRASAGGWRRGRATRCAAPPTRRSTSRGCTAGWRGRRAPQAPTWCTTRCPRTAAGSRRPRWPPCTTWPSPACAATTAAPGAGWPCAPTAAPPARPPRWCACPRPPPPRPSRSSAPTRGRIVVAPHGPGQVKRPGARARTAPRGRCCSWATPSRARTWRACWPHTRATGPWPPSPRRSSWRGRRRARRVSPA